jgi:hypothetical protein
MQDIMLFNSIISNLGLREIPLKGRQYTWSNMQRELLLEQLDWCFTSINWISDYPNTLMTPLARTTSDQTPCVVQISTDIPKGNLFRFENFWVEQQGFYDLVKMVWESNVRATTSASTIVAKFQLLQRVLKKWSQSLSQLKIQLKKCNEIISVLDKLEKNRPLYLTEANLRSIIQKHIENLLKAQKEY